MRATGRRAVRALAVVALLLAPGTVAACGLSPEANPQPVSPAPGPVSLPPAPTATGVVHVYLLRGEHLVSVDRVGRTASDALALLAAGPTPLDQDSGLTTALPAGAVGRTGREDPDVVTVEVGPDVAALPARRQLLAVAQLVWTATGVCCDSRLRVLLDGRPLTVATDRGPVGEPVRRDDYRSVAP